MKNDADNIRNSLLWLLHEFGELDLKKIKLEKLDPTFSLPSGNGSTFEVNLTEASEFEVGSDATSMKPAQPKGSEETPPGLSSYPSTSASASLIGALRPSFSAASRGVLSTDTRSQTAQSFNFGEIHAVQERFQALIKQRLLSEYESNPPLFPWESEVSEYPAEVADYVPVAVASPLWSAHMSALKVPGLLPTALMNTLFERCQEIVRSPIKQGVRLVRAVEDLFPESSDMLEPIANMVLVPAYRSSRDTQDAVIQELANAAGGYNAAMPEQQIALSMLAAQEILGALTFSLSVDWPSEKRSWVTALGVLEITASYQGDSLSNQLNVVAVLPDGGQVKLCDGEVEKQAMRSQPGALDLTWAQPTLGKAYVLEVSLGDEDRALSFVISIANAAASAGLGSLARGL